MTCTNDQRLTNLYGSDVFHIQHPWLNKFYSCYMATVVIIVNGRGLGIGMHRTH